MSGMKLWSHTAFRLAFFVGFLTGHAALPQLESLRPKRADVPNIIFILADDLGYGDLGCYGQKKIKTPNIDRLAEEGMRFTQCYAGSTVCAPSRCCLMTGVHTGHARIRGNARVALEPGDLTVAEILKPAGYRTAAFGKWGLGNEGTSGIPNKHGFDEWFGYLDQTLAHNYYPEWLWRNERQWQVPGNANGQKGDYSHDWFTRTSTNFIRINQKYPFFLYLAYTIPHANNELKDKGMEVPNDAPYSKEDWPQQEKNKAAMITRLDADVGGLGVLGFPADGGGVGRSQATQRHRWHFHGPHPARLAADQPARILLLGVSRARLPTGRAHGRLEGREARP